MELGELQIGHRHPGPDRHRQPVCGGSGRIGGHCPKLSRSAGRQGHDRGMEEDGSGA